MTELVFALERAYATAGAAKTIATRTDDEDHRAALGAVASRYLAVGTPRSIGLVGDVGGRSLAAHRTWFAPTDVRSTSVLDGARVVTLDEALAADIVCVHDAIALGARQLRRGTHVNVLVSGFALDPELAAIAAVSREHPDLGRLAAGLVDGRQLDEITVFLIR